VKAADINPVKKMEITAGSRRKAACFADGKIFCRYPEGAVIIIFKLKIPENCQLNIYPITS